MPKKKLRPPSRNEHREVRDQAKRALHTAEQTAELHAEWLRELRDDIRSVRAAMLILSERVDRQVPQLEFFAALALRNLAARALSEDCAANGHPRIDLARAFVAASDALAAAEGRRGSNGAPAPHSSSTVEPQSDQPPPLVDQDAPPPESLDASDEAAQQLDAFARRGLAAQRAVDVATAPRPGDRE